MTIAALAGVGVLAAQAAATAPKVSSNASGTRSAASTANPATGSGTSAGPAANPLALPTDSGAGARIVYSVNAKRVWLASAANAALRSFPIVPGNIPAPPGEYSVLNRLSSVTGTDGTAVQYVVLFGKVRYNGSTTALGFDAVANVTGMPPAPSGHTAGIRMAQADAQALWNFSTFGTKVVVVP